MGFFVVYSLTQMFTGAFDYRASAMREGTTFITTIIALSMLLISGIAPVGFDEITTYPATNTRVGDQLVIQAENVPTQISSDISLIDKPVQIKEIHQHNAWGGGMGIKYEIEVIKTER